VTLINDRECVGEASVVRFSYIHPKQTKSSLFEICALSPGARVWFLFDDEYVLTV
jgi:hypothetical protein